MATRYDRAGPTPAVHLKRALGVWDLTFLCVVAILNLNVVPVIAANGPVTLWLWMAALLLFFLPQGIAVIELSHHFPQEGGIYVWTKEMFGDLHGFLCGWCYWTNNMFYIPTLLFYLVGIVTYTRRPLCAWAVRESCLLLLPDCRVAVGDSCRQYSRPRRGQVGQ